jgi:6-pyruvoyltetrahydropterin/6-carboxytetrahydropterin synthase
MAEHWEAFTEFRFEAAHFLPNVPEGHKCRRLHGHSFRVRVTLRSAQLSKAGWVEDFGTIKERLEPIRQKLDHYLLNDIEGLENPTSEVLAAWLWPKVKQVLPEISIVEVLETCTSGCRYQGP